MKVVILGSTGSVGMQAVNVCKKMDYQIVGLSYYNEQRQAEQIINENQVKYFYTPLKDQYQSNVNSYEELIKQTKPDIVLNAISGFAGLEASLIVIKQKIPLALANKESLVVGGKFIIALAKKHNVPIYPVDSEHASVYRLIKNNHFDAIKNIYITASGGPFYHLTKNQLVDVKFKEAIKHPNWSMGEKISLDSATLMNKCFELIEAYWLFDQKKIIPIYHPQSLCHGFIEFNDHAIQMLISTTSMELPIQNALNQFKDCHQPIINSLSFANLNLHFDYLDKEKFIALQYFDLFMKNVDSNIGIILNAADEVAFELFKNDKIKFLDIFKLINEAIEYVKIKELDSIEQIYQTDQIVRQYLKERYK